MQAAEYKCSRSFFKMFLENNKNQKNSLHLKKKNTNAVGNRLIHQNI